MAAFGGDIEPPLQRISFSVAFPGTVNWTIAILVNGNSKAIAKGISVRRVPLRKSPYRIVRKFARGMRRRERAEDGSCLGCRGFILFVCFFASLPSEFLFSLPMLIASLPGLFFAWVACIILVNRDENDSESPSLSAILTFLFILIIYGGFVYVVWALSTR